MKRYVDLILIIPLTLLFADCSSDEGLGGNSDFSDETIQSSKTAELLDAILTRPYDHTKLTPWCIYCENTNIQGVTMFNNGLLEDKMITELFKKEDCFSIFEAKYQIFLKKIDWETNEGLTLSGQIAYFEMLLASDMCMSVINEREKVRLMEMAVKKLNYEKKRINEACHIMISVMQSCSYTPFIEEIVPILYETINGYTFDDPDSNILVSGLGDYQSKIIANYAQQFLNEKN
jgi:hypothetical protein